jgi:hypothetical protein
MDRGAAAATLHRVDAHLAFLPNRSSKNRRIEAIEPGRGRQPQLPWVIGSAVSITGVATIRPPHRLGAVRSWS